MISIRHIRKQYPNGGACPIRDFSAEINKGDVIAIIGPSGTGKSTLLNCINLLDPPTAGEIYIDGECVTAPGYDLTALRRKVGMVFQSFNLFNHMSVIENCMVAVMDLGGLSRQEAYDRAMYFLKKVGMEKQALKYPKTLSGGQKQRVAIARALTNGTEVILFDEPTSALDPISVRDVNAVIRDLAESGTTMLIVTHDMGFAREVANRVFYLDDGILYEDGSPEQIFNAPLKEKTRRFTRLLNVLPIIVSAENPDYEECFRKLRVFSREHALSGKTINRLSLLIEELVFQMMLPLAEDTDVFSIQLDFRRKENIIVLSVDSTGPVDPFENADPVSMSIISAMSGGVQEREGTAEYPVRFSMDVPLD